MVLYFLWLVTLTAPLIALALSTGCAPLPRTISETALVTSPNDSGALAVPAEGAGDFWRREHSREIKFGQGGIVSIIDRAGPRDEGLTETLIRSLNPDRNNSPVPPTVKLPRERRRAEVSA